jgi:hypothetical protein
VLDRYVIKRIVWVYEQNDVLTKRTRAAKARSGALIITAALLVESGPPLAYGAYP